MPIIDARKKSIDYIIRTIWEAAVPPAVFAVLTLIAYLTMAPKNLWHAAVMQVLGQLYVISFFITL